MMDDKEQAEHDRAVENYVDVTLRNCLSILRIIESDMKLAEDIPAEDGELRLVAASRAFVVYKSFTAYGASVTLNEHVRGVLLMEGRKEINETIDGKLTMILSWFEDRRKKHPAFDKMMREMQTASDVAQAFHMGQQEGKKR